MDDFNITFSLIVSLHKFVLWRSIVDPARFLVFLLVGTGYVVYFFARLNLRIYNEQIGRAHV